MAAPSPSANALLRPEVLASLSTLELVARYHELDVDDDAFVGGANSFANPLTAISKESAYGIGVNWYPWNTVKLSLNYETTAFEGGAATGDRADEDLLFSRFAINF